MPLRDGQRVFVAEAFLRRRHPGWHVPHVEWHLGRVTFGYEPGDMIALPSVNVNVFVDDLQPADFLLVAD